MGSQLGPFFLAMVLGEIVLYAVALPWLGLFVGMHRVLALGFLPFISGDALKMMIAGGLFPAAWKLVGSRPSQPDA